MPRNYNNQSKVDADFLWLDSSEKNKIAYQSIASQDLMDIALRAKVITPPSYRLVRFDKGSDSFEVAMLCDATEEVVYLIKCNIWEDVFLNSKPVTQVLLWRTNDVIHQAATSRLAETVFREYLLDEYNIIASDVNQTSGGRDFWIRQMGHALNFGEFVYRYDLLEGKLTRLTDHSKIRDNSCDLWGDGEEYESVLAVISKTELKNQ